MYVLDTLRNQIAKSYKAHELDTVMGYPEHVNHALIAFRYLGIKI